MSNFLEKSFLSNLFERIIRVPSSESCLNVLERNYRTDYCSLLSEANEFRVLPHLFSAVCFPLQSLFSEPYKGIGKLGEIYTLLSIFVRENLLCEKNIRQIEHCTVLKNVSIKNVNSDLLMTVICRFFIYFDPVGLKAFLDQSFVKFGRL